MTAKLFLVIIDTTEATMRQTVGMGILNVHGVMAENAISAKQTLLQVFTPQVRAQIQNSLYVYDMEEMSKVLKTMPPGRLPPMFSFIPLTGGRPQRQSDTPQAVSTTLGNQTQNPSTIPAVVAQKPQAPQQQQRPINPATVSNSRSREFQNFDAGRPTTTNNLTPEQAAMIRGVGAGQRSEGADEGSNPRINASTGTNQNLRNVPEDLVRNNNLTQEQANLLRALASSGPEIVEADVAAENPNVMVVEDTSLAEIDNKVLSDEDIAKLNADIQDVK